MSNEISVKEAKMCMDGGAIFLDVRTDEEYSEGHIDGSAHIGIVDPKFGEKLNELNKSRSYVVYCGSGGRSARAVKTMLDFGFGDVHNLTGGITDWKKEGLPVVK